MASRVGKEHTVSEDERVENRWEEFEAHKLEPERNEDGQVEVSKLEDTQVETGRAEDDDFEAHQLEVARVEDVGQVDLGRVEDA